MKLHLNHKGRPLCGARSWQYIGDKNEFDKAKHKHGACKRCLKKSRSIVKDEDSGFEPSYSDDDPF
jgi:hypothetical protein